MASAMGNSRILRLVHRENQEVDRSPRVRNGAKGRYRSKSARRQTPRGGHHRRADDGEQRRDAQASGARQGGVEQRASHAPSAPARPHIPLPELKRAVRSQARGKSPCDAGLIQRNPLEALRLVCRELHELPRVIVESGAAVTGFRKVGEMGAVLGGQLTRDNALQDRARLDNANAHASPMAPASVNSAASGASPMASSTSAGCSC